MASEIQVSFETGKTIYSLVRNAVGQIWNGSAFEAYQTANYTTYDISMSEQGSASGFYVGNFPAAIAGVYDIVAKQQLGGGPAETDPTIAIGQLQWSGTVTLPLSNLATSGFMSQFLPTRITKGNAISGFPFKMVSAADHITPLTSGVISGQVMRDGSSFSVLQSGTLAAGYMEKGYGWYTVNLTSGDLNGDTAALRFTAPGADPRDMALITQKIS